jgi:hypothetical protein
MSNDEVDAWLANQQFGELQSYIARGRALANVETEELLDRWIEAMEAWGLSPAVDHRARADIEAELGLRRVLLPWHQVKDAVDALLTRSRAEADALEADPVKLSAKERELAARLHRFLTDTRKATRN